MAAASSWVASHWDSFRSSSFRDWGFLASRDRAFSFRPLRWRAAISLSASSPVSSFPAQRAKSMTSFSPRRRMEPSSSTASHRPWTRLEGFNS